ncbi:histone deacetylase domain-containing protein [Schizophyllum commune]
MLRHRDTDSELGALYLVPNREGTGKTLVRRPNPPPTSPPLDDDFDAMTQAGTTTRGAQTEWGTHLRESRAFTATPLWSDFDACTYTAAPGETRSEWQMGIGQANATRGTPQTSPRKGPGSLSTRVLAGDARQPPSRAGSVARHATGRSGSEWGQSQDGWPQGPPRGAVVRRSPTTTSRASSKRLPNPPSERDWPPPVRRETEIIQGNTEFSMVRRRVLEDSPQKTVTISTWREQVAEEAAQATEPEPEMSVYFVGADDYPESVAPVPGSTRVIEEVRGLGMDSSARSASPPMLPQGTTPPRKASYGSRADSRRTGTSSSPRSLPSPPPRTSTPNGVNSPTSQLNRRYTHSRRGSSPQRRILSSLFHPTQSGATISSIKTPEGAFDRVLDSCEPSLLHIAPVLESLGMTSEEHLRAVARLSEDTRDKEIREEALRMGVTIVEWAILIDKLQTFHEEVAGLRNRFIGLGKAKAGRRERACPQADFPRERRVAVASINLKVKMSSPSLGGQHTFYVQNKCFDHRYIRSADLSAIVERPERLRAVLVGLSAANSRLGELVASSSTAEVKREFTPSDELADALSRLDISPNKDSGKGDNQAWNIRHTDAALKILDNPAVKFVHGDIDGDVYLENLSKWAKESTEKIQQGGSEIPEGYAQGDLYLCPESIDAMQGAMGTVCEAVDDVIAGRTRRAFAAIRPPGHHCGEDTPSGFCFVNNVVVGAAHAHLKHGVRRVVVFDIDLHHGNGTQSLIWQINEETYRQTLESEAGAPDVKPGPQMYYSSLHDILSYPCEDGKSALVQAASVSIRGEHGQHVENVHLQTWKSHEEFNALYQSQYTKVIRRAEEFLDKTGGPGKDVLVFISCGFDACEHEYESMQRHKRNVPTSFYYQFARDACAFSDRYADGRLISVLEGGYGDRALISGSLAHLCGLSDLPGVRPEWWQVDNLVKLEKATKKRRGGRASLATPEPWLDRAIANFDALKEKIPALSEKGKTSKAPIPPRSMQLRQRKKPGEPMTPPTSRPASRPSSAAASPAPIGQKKQPLPVESTTSDSSSLTESEEETQKPIADASTARKLPRVVLKLGPRPQEG